MLLTQSGTRQIDVFWNILEIQCSIFILLFLLAPRERRRRTGEKKPRDCKTAHLEESLELSIETIAA